MFAQRIRSWLVHPRLPWVALAVAMLLLLPSLGFGLRMDDRLHRIFVRGDPAYPALTAPPYRLFDFFTGPERIEMFRRTGMAAWYADPDCSIAFFRPLTSLVHYAEHRWLGEHLWAMHALSMLLFGALVGAVWALYRRLFVDKGGSGGAEAAGLGVWMYAVDRTHGLPAAWIAQQNSLLSGLFGVLTVLAHDRARRDGDRRAAWAAPALLLLALLSAEAGSATVAVLLAHALTLERPGQRLRALAPYALGLLPWLLLYLGGHYGVRNSGMYLDPLRSPGTALPLAIKHFVVLLGGELGNPLVDFWPLAPDSMRWATVAFSALMTACLGLAAWPLLKRDATARFLALSSALVLLPPSATFPQTRLLMFSGVFQLGLLAQVACALLRSELDLPRPWRWIAVGFTCYVAGGHVLLEPPLLLTTSSQMVTFERALGRFTQGLPDDPTGRKIAVVVNAPDMTFVGYLSLLGPPMKKPTPRVMALVNGTRDSELTVVDDHTVRIKSEGGFVHGGTDGLTRADSSPLAVGATFDIGGARYEVTGLNAEGRADTALVRFDAPLTDPSLAFFRWQGDTLAPMQLLPQGQTLRIAGQPFLPVVLAAAQGGGADVPGR